MKKKSEWIEEIESEIIQKKKNDRNKIYLISAEMNTETANGIVKHFLDQGYDVESKKCGACKNKWDLILQWK